MHNQEFIRVVGARDNNLKEISVDIPKRKLTVFTGVSGSGKSSLVFGTIAAESQRLINETYPGFVQGFMQSQAHPDVDELSGLTAAIMVGQEPMAANSRSTFGTATDITGALRVLFSRIASPRVGGPAAYSFNVPSTSGQGAIEVNGVKEVRRFERTGGMCPTCEGTGRALANRPERGRGRVLEPKRRRHLVPRHESRLLAVEGLCRVGLVPGR